MNKEYHIAIIGGGASGMVAALRIKQIMPEARVVIIEKKEALGKKLAVTGGGRCNITNAGCKGFSELEKFFQSIGIMVMSDNEDRCYPHNEDAKDLVTHLTNRVKTVGVDVLLSSPVSSIQIDGKSSYIGNCMGVDRHAKGEEMQGKAAKGVDAKERSAYGKTSCRAFKIKIENKEDIIFADNVLIATGGKSYGNLGTSGDGYGLARSFGHSIVKPVPGLTAIEAMDDIKSLKGVRAKAEVTLLCKGKVINTEFGEVQFREDCVSGICVMNTSSRIVLDDDTKFSDYVLRMDFLEAVSDEYLEAFMCEMRGAEGFRAADLMATMVKSRLAEVMLKRARIAPERPAKTMSDADIASIVEQMRGFELTVSGLKGWSEAQVTIGGVALSEVDEDTQESKLVDGLFFSGEVLDYAGPCGGYNLHHAWMSGLRAAEALAGERVLPLLGNELE